MSSSTVRTVIGWAALAALTLVCLKVASFAPLVVDWGRELAAGAITLVAVAVGMRLATARADATTPPTPTPPAAAPTPTPTPTLSTPPPSTPTLTPPAATPTPEPAPEPDEGVLTPRERQILRLLDGGLTNKELSAQLGVSENTVKTHLANLYAKLGVGRRTEALAVARRRGWLG